MNDDFKFKELLNFVRILSKEGDSILSVQFYSHQAKELLKNLDLYE